MNRKDFFSYTLVSVLTAILTAAVVFGGFWILLQKQPELLASMLNMPNNEQHTTVVSDTSESRVIDAVADASPAVVAITVSKNVPVYERYYEEGPRSLRDFFGGSFFFPQIRQNGTELQEVGGGSGFLVSEDGYLVTNKHVVSDENAEYTVFTNDGKSYDAQVIARDPTLDVALLKIDGTGFDHLVFGDSDELQVGQSVIAIGNALGEFRNTVSVGVVSGLSRSIVASDHRGGFESLDQLIQTDTAINQGNSGGPLLNLSGEVIGVNVAIVSGAQNVGFALSANSVKTMVESVKEHGRIVRPYMGIRYIPVTQSLQERNSLPVDHGALIQRGASPEELAVIPGSPADKAGLTENDIILEIDGVEINEDRSLASIIRTKQVGDSILLTVYSEGEEKMLTLTLEEMPL